MGISFAPRRGIFINIQDEASPAVSSEELAVLERLDLIYRSLCAMLYNYVPTSGHPGGSISSGRFAASLVFDAMDYDASDPDREDADLLVYAAGHKALGLYSLWAIRNEVLRVGAPALLSPNESRQLRLEDLLGFRKNPAGMTPLLPEASRKSPGRASDRGATPFVRIATGASGSGLRPPSGLRSARLTATAPTLRASTWWREKEA